MATEQTSQYVTATSFESFEQAALEALAQVPALGEGYRGARVVEQFVSEGGFVGRPQYRVTLAAVHAATGD